MESTVAAIVETEWLKTYLAEFSRGHHVALASEYIVNTAIVAELKLQPTTIA